MILFDCDFDYDFDGDFNYDFDGDFNYDFTGDFNYDLYYERRRELPATLNRCWGRS